MTLHRPDHTPDYRGDYSAAQFRAPVVVSFMFNGGFDERRDYESGILGKIVVRPVVTCDARKSAVFCPLTTRLLSKSQKERNSKKSAGERYARASSQVLGSEVAR